MKICLSVTILSIFIFSSCDKKKKEKFGIHDHPVFLEQCDNAVLASIFEEPKEDPFRSTHLAWLKEHHPKIHAYGELHKEILSRELMLAAAIYEKFDLNQNHSVVFIGATDGELPRLFSEVFGVQKITVIDLKPCLELAARKLFESSINWVTPNQINENLEIDLVISGNTFSHLSEPWQKYLLETVFAKAKGGALFYQATPRHWGVKSWKKERFLGHLKKHFHVESNDQEFSKFLTEDTSSFILFAQ
jgi:hypothetical protein